PSALRDGAPQARVLQGPADRRPEPCATVALAWGLGCPLSPHARDEAIAGEPEPEPPLDRSRDPDPRPRGDAACVRLIRWLDGERARGEIETVVAQGDAECARQVPRARGEP